MKKLVFLTIALCGLAISSFAQTSPPPQTGKWNFGLDAGLPLGDLHEGYKSAIGASVKYEYPVSRSTFVTLSAGYSVFLYNDEMKQYYRSLLEKINPVLVKYQF